MPPSSVTVACEACGTGAAMRLPVPWTISGAVASDGADTTGAALGAAGVELENGSRACAASSAALGSGGLSVSVSRGGERSQHGERGRAKADAPCASTPSKNAPPERYRLCFCHDVKGLARRSRDRYKRPLSASGRDIGVCARLGRRRRGDGRRRWHGRAWPAPSLRTGAGAAAAGGGFGAAGAGRADWSSAGSGALGGWLSGPASGMTTSAPLAWSVTVLGSIAHHGANRSPGRPALRSTCCWRLLIRSRATARSPPMMMPASAKSELAVRAAPACVESASGLRFAANRGCAVDIGEKSASDGGA